MANPQIENILVQLENTVSDFSKRLSITAASTLIRSTPVDTGRARSNWLVGIDQSREDTIDAYFPGSGGNTSGPNVTRAINEAISRIELQRGFQSIFISNNLPYIIRLNEGSSFQAPSGFVQSAISEAIRAASRSF